MTMQATSGSGKVASSSGGLTMMGPTPEEPFMLRIVSLDYYLAPPLPEVDITWSELEGGHVQAVPVLRIFGSTPGGQKACVHVHKVGKGEQVCV
jgi:hypothetical protein